MNVARLFIAHALLVTSLFMGIVPAYAQWLCVDPDGSVSFESDEAKAICCARFQEDVSERVIVDRGEAAVVHPNAPKHCHDYAIGNGSKAVQKTFPPSFTPKLVLLPPRPIEFPLLVSQEFSPRWLHPVSHALDSPTLACLMTVIIVV